MTTKQKSGESMRSKKEDMNYCLQVDQPSTKSTQPSEMPGKKIMMIDIMMLEDKIQSITNKLQYVRNIEDMERKKMEDARAELTFDLKRLTDILNHS